MEEKRENPYLNFLRAKKTKRKRDSFLGGRKMERDSIAVSLILFLLRYGNEKRVAVHIRPRFPFFVLLLLSAMFLLSMQQCNPFSSLALLHHHRRESSLLRASIRADIGGCREEATMMPEIGGEDIPSLSRVGKGTVEIQRSSLVESKFALVCTLQ